MLELLVLWKNKHQILSRACLSALNKSFVRQFIIICYVKIIIKEFLIHFLAHDLTSLVSIHYSFLYRNFKTWKRFNRDYLYVFVILTATRHSTWVIIQKSFILSNQSYKGRFKIFKVQPVMLWFSLFSDNKNMILEGRILAENQSVLSTQAFLNTYSCLKRL